MIIEVKKEVANHLVNDNYDCLLVTFCPSDTNFFRDKCNWMPKDDEIFRIFKILFNISPTFKEKVDKYIKERGG